MPPMAQEQRAHDSFHSLRARWCRAPTTPVSRNKTDRLSDSRAGGATRRRIGVRNSCPRPLCRGTRVRRFPYAPRHGTRPRLCPGLDHGPGPFPADALTAAGCAQVWTDVASGARDDRPELARLLERLLPGDTLVVWRLDRLGRSLPHLLATITELEGRGVGFRFLTESNDTTTAGGRLIFGALAELRAPAHPRPHPRRPRGRPRARAPWGATHRHDGSADRDRPIPPCRPTSHSGVGGQEPRRQQGDPVSHRPRGGDKRAAAVSRCVRGRRWRIGWGSGWAWLKRWDLHHQGPRSLEGLAPGVLRRDDLARRAARGSGALRAAPTEGDEPSAELPVAMVGASGPSPRSGRCCGARTRGPGPGRTSRRPRALRPAGPPGLAAAPVRNASATGVGERCLPNLCGCLVSPSSAWPWTSACQPPQLGAKPRDRGGGDRHHGRPHRDRPRQPAFDSHGYRTIDF